MSFFRSFFFPINEKENKTLCHSLPLIQGRKVGNSQLLNTMQTFPVLLPSNEKSRERKIKKKKKKRYGRITSILKTQNFILFYVCNK